MCVNTLHAALYYYSTLKTSSHVWFVCVYVCASVYRQRERQKHSMLIIIQQYIILLLFVLSSFFYGAIASSWLAKKQQQEVKVFQVYNLDLYCILYYVLIPFVVLHCANFPDARLI